MQGIVLSPLLLLKTRVMTDPSFRDGNLKGLWKTTVASSKVGAQIISKEGLGVLMKGSGVFTVKRIADWTTRFFFAELVATQWVNARGGKKLNKTEDSIASFVGGAMSATVTIPIDVLVATIQDASKAGQKVSIVDTWRSKMNDGGLMGLVRYSCKGMVFRIAHVAATTVLMKSISSFV